MAEVAGDIGASNNLPLAIHFGRAFDRDVLGRALKDVVSAHPALRTRFLTHNGRLKRVESPPADVELVVPVVEVEAKSVDAYIEERSRIPLDLLSEPWKAWLVQFSSGGGLFLAVFHHAIFDGPSKDLFIEELLTRSAGSARIRLGKRRAGASFAEHVSREREAIEQHHAEARRFWEPKLPLVRDALTWPVSPHADASGCGGGALRFEVNAERADRLAAVAASAGTSLFTALLTVVQLLQHIYAGRSPGGVATAIPLGTRRNDERSEIGMFVNEVALYSEPDPDQPFSTFLTDTARRASEIMALREFPYTEAVSSFGRGYDPRTLTPPVSLSYWRTGGSSTIESALEAHADRRLPVYGRRVPLSFRFVAGPEGIAGGFEYDSSFLHDQAARRVVDGLVTVIERVSAQPHRSLRDISPLPPDERARLVTTWNSTSMRESPGTVVDLIRRTARRHPDRVAVEANDETLTYHDLELRSESLCLSLARRGIGHGALVGIYLERGVNLLLAVLGTLKAGAAYVPLDPRYPAERLAFMVEDSRSSVVLTEQTLAPRFPRSERPLVMIDDASDEPGSAPPAPRPEERAYVIYTSGSTGWPKGVELSHAGVSNLVRALCHVPGLREDDVFLSMTTLSFDIGSVELLAPLTAGAKVIIAPALTSADGAAMVALLSTSGATVTFATPSSWRLAIRAGWKGGQKVLVGGEPLPSALAADLISRSDDVWNIYGPTETTVFSTCRRIVDGNDITIGRPVANTKLYVVDREHQLAPTGVPGELWIGGAGVATGYLNRSELTADRFIANPFAANGSRVYKTGDLVRYRDDGNLEFLGRLDDQIKIRGNRIEPGEIEALLAAQAGVREAAVIPREASDGDVRLVAYVISSERRLSPRALREAVAERLPESMVPSAFVLLDELPLLPNGKLDRHRLPDPPADVGGDEHVPPADPVEEVLAGIWASVLGVPRVSVCANFFELGGHSLMVADVITKAREALAVHVPIGLIFAAPTVRKMARELRSDAATSEPLVDMPTATRRPLSELA